MTFSQIEVLEYPRAGSRLIKRGIINQLLRTKKLAISRVKKARSKSLAAVRRQYYLTTAYGDMTRSLKKNEDIFIASAIIAALVLFAAARVVFEFAFMFIGAGYALSVFSGISIFLWLMAASVICAVFYTWICAFVLNMLSISLMHGATGKKHRSLRSTARQGLKYASRVSMIWTILALLVVVPIGAAATIAAVYLRLFPMPLESILALTPAAIILAISWMTVAVMNYGLAPQVALFEPNLPAAKVFAKSRRLVTRRGRPFLLIGHFVGAAGLAVSYQLSTLAERFLHVSRWLFVFVFVMSLAVVSNGILTMLYRKRTLARIK